MNDVVSRLREVGRGMELKIWEIGCGPGDVEKLQFSYSCVRQGVYGS